LPPALALQVAEALTKRDALAAHVRDELGLEDDRRARPLQAAGSSALAFASGAILPLGAALVVGGSLRALAVVVVTLVASSAPPSNPASLEARADRPGPCRTRVTIRRGVASKTHGLLARRRRLRAFSRRPLDRLTAVPQRISADLAPAATFDHAGGDK
jgi:VIT family protein